MSGGKQYDLEDRTLAFARETRVFVNSPLKNGFRREIERNCRASRKKTQAMP